MIECKLLDGLKVVDLGVGMATALITKMLANLGATVTRVPPIGGDPFTDDYPAYTVWQRLATVDQCATQSPEKLASLLATADVCVLGGEDHPELVRRTDGATIARTYPRLVVLNIAAGPTGTAYAERPSTELLAQVRSGLVWEQEPDRPIVNAFEPASYGAALQGLIGLLAALYERESSDKGQLVSTSLFEGSLTWASGHWSQIEKPSPAANYRMPLGLSTLIFRAKDGVWLQILMGSKGSKYGLYKVLNIDDPTVQPTDSGMPQPGAGRHDFFGDCDLLSAHVAKMDSKDILEGLWAIGLPAEPVLAPGAAWTDPQIARNGIISTAPDGTRHVGLPFRFKTNTCAPVPRSEDVKTRPLDGVKVLDCGAFVAGPLASVFLADLGAEVIKVESIEGDPNRASFKWFAQSNRGKKGLMVNLKAPEGKQLVMSLCDKADIVMNNFRPGVSARLGVDPESLHARNPGLIVLEAPAYGTEGPSADKAGFDMVMQAWCGHDVKAAGQGNAPRWNRTCLVDVTGGMLGAVAMLAGLVHRARCGNGVALEVPLVNAGIFTLSELIQGPDGNFQGIATLNHKVTGYHPTEALYQGSR